MLVSVIILIMDRLTKIIIIYIMVRGTVMCRMVNKAVHFRISTVPENTPAVMLYSGKFFLTMFCIVSGGSDANVNVIWNNL